MIVGLKELDNGEVRVIDTSKMEIRVEKRTNKKSTLYYSLLETENHKVGLSDPNIEYMLLGITADGACMIDVGSNNIFNTTMYILQELIYSGKVGNLKHNGEELSIECYTDNKEIIDNTKIEVKEKKSEFEEYIVETKEKEEITDEKYIKQRTIRFILWHNVEYTEIESIDYIKNGDIYEIWKCRTKDGEVVCRNLIQDDVSPSNIEFELLKMERNNEYRS